MKLKIKLNDSFNSRIYSKECVEDLCKRYKNINIPFKLFSKVTNDPPVIGTALLSDMEYPEICIDVDTKSDVVQHLLQNNIGGLVMNVATAPSNINITDNIEYISKVDNINSIDYTINRDTVCSFEIVTD